MIAPSSTIASAELMMYDDTDIDPTIAAAQRLQKLRCQACLIGIHPASQCYIRGIKFQPEELRRRIALYNKQFGSEPPTGVQIKEWAPKSIPPIHQTKKSVSFSDHTSNHKKKMSNPFKPPTSKTKAGPAHLKARLETIHIRWMCWPQKAGRSTTMKSQSISRISGTISILHSATALQTK